MIQWPFLAYIAAQVAVILDWNGLYGPMGPVLHVRCLDLVVGAMPGAQWVPNDRLSVSFLA